jgi:F-box and leucine-rich repeat protein 2/20
MVAITTNCTSLKFIGISNCTHLTDATLISLGQNCHELKILEASGCLNFSDNGFLVISKVMCLFKIIFVLIFS